MTTNTLTIDENTAAGGTAVRDALRESALLVQARTSAWVPTKRDRNLSANMADANLGDSDAFIGIKKLMVGEHARTFTAISTLLAGFRQRMLAMTLPYGTGVSRLDVGPRILANARFMDAQKLLVATKAQLDTLLDDAVDGYARAMDDASRKLGNAFTASDYPDPSALRGLYGVDLTFSPVPDTGSFIGLPQDAMLVLGEKLAQDHSAVVTHATANMATRVTDYLDRFFERVVECHKANSGDAKYDDRRAPRVVASLFEDAAELADFVEAYAPMLGSNANITTAVARLRDISRMEPDDFRDNDALLVANAAANEAYDCFGL